MDRCALFVDAGYLLADGAMAVHGTHRRESVTWDYPGLLQVLANLAMERSRMPLLRCYWYDSTVEGRRTPDHDSLADLPGVKLRLAKMRPGRREGVEGEIHRDLTTLARNKAVSDAMVVTGDEDLAEVIADVQDMGMRVTLLHVATDGNSEIPRALRQECDDLVEINVAQLRPFAELITGAEPPRQGEREGGMLALREVAGVGVGSGLGSNGNGNGHALAGRVTRATGASSGGADGPGGSGGSGGSVGSGGSQQTATPSLVAASASQYQQPAVAVRSARGEEQVGGREEANRAEAPAAEFGQPEFGQPEFAQADRADRAERVERVERADRTERPERSERADGAAEYAALEQYATVGDYGTASDYRSPLGDYGAPAEYGPGPSIPDFTPAPAAAPAASLVPEYSGMPAREELYGAPVVVPAAVEELPAERTSGRQRPEPDALRQVESGYNPGGARDQFQLEAGMREPVPAGAAQVRRLPTRGGGQPPASQPSPGQAAPSRQGSGLPGVPGGLDQGGGTSGSAGQSIAPIAPIAPVVPMEQAGPGYGGGRGGGYGGSRPANGPVSPVSPVSLVGQPSGTSGPLGPSVRADAAGPGNGGGGQQGQGGYNGQNAQGGQGGGHGGHGGQQEPGAHPMLSPVVAPPSAGYQDAGGPAGYSGGQSGVSLADAVQSAHEEGQAFGESVARDAPALWLEAVLARKPRMPSDLEARLLQGSALPIDFLLHDEVRHALRRGFWDALERARR